MTGTPCASRVRAANSCSTKSRIARSSSSPARPGLRPSRVCSSTPWRSTRPRRCICTGSPPGRSGHYLDNLCRSWSDALDNFRYAPLTVGRRLAGRSRHAGRAAAAAGGSSAAGRLRCLRRGARSDWRTQPSSCCSSADCRARSCSSTRWSPETKDPRFGRAQRFMRRAGAPNFSCSFPGRARPRSPRPRRASASRACAGSP